MYYYYRNSSILQADVSVETILLPRYADLSVNGRSIHEVVKVDEGKLKAIDDEVILYFLKNLVFCFVLLLTLSLVRPPLRLLLVFQFYTRNKNGVTSFETLFVLLTSPSKRRALST